MTDVFEEVEEQLRAARYKSFALRALPFVLGALVLGLLVAGGLWGWDAWRARAMTQASETYAEGIEAFGSGEVERAAELFGQVSESRADGYAALALMQLGGLRLAEDDVEGAARLLDQAAERASDPLIADAARLKSALALLDTASLEDMQARLTPLTQDGRPYRTQAMEALAFAKLMAGQTDEARADFGVIALMPGASAAARQRAQAARAMIDSGSAAALPATVKAALAQPSAASDSNDDAAATPPQQQGSAEQ